MGWWRGAPRRRIERTVVAVTSLPQALHTVLPGDLYKVCPDLSLFQLDGRTKSSVVVSVMLHGNEPSGLFALQTLLSSLSAATPYRTLLVLVGNVQAARANVRKLPEGDDYNRIWFPGAHARASAIMAELKKRDVVACFDLHNTSGKNPLFSILAHMNQRSLELASLMRGPVMYAPWTKGPLNAECGQHFPSVTVELKNYRDTETERHVAEQIAHLLNAPEPFSRDPLSGEIPFVVGVEAIAYRREVALPKGQRHSFELVDGLDQYNFKAVPEGTVWASSDPESYRALQVVGPEGDDVTETYFSFENGRIVSVLPFVPTLLSTDNDAIHQDCIAYMTQPMSTRELRRLACAQ